MARNNNKKKFLVIGLGAIGKILSVHLKKKGHYVCGVDIRSDFVDAVRKKGIVVEGYTTKTANLDEVHTKIEKLSEKKFDYIVVSVKTPYMEKVVNDLQHLDNNGSRIVSMQNGIDNEEFLARFFERDRILRMVINFAGNILSPGAVKMTFFHKPNYIGCICNEKPCGHAKEFASILTQSQLDTESSDDIKKFAWKKTILVAALAPVSAIVEMTMADIMADGDTRSWVVKLLREAIEVARVQGFDYGDGFFAHCLDYLSTAGHHKPSMLIDIENGMQTEIEYINGKIAYYGHELNVPVLLNTSITSLIKAKERLKIKQIQKK